MKAEKKVEKIRYFQDRESPYIFLRWHYPTDKVEIWNYEINDWKYCEEGRAWVPDHDNNREHSEEEAMKRIKKCVAERSK